MSTFASMIDERAYELALSQLAQAREEKMLLFEQVKRLTEEVAMLRSSSDNQADRQTETIKDQIQSVSHSKAPTLFTLSSLKSIYNQIYFVLPLENRKKKFLCFLHNQLRVHMLNCV